jgi:hypothetical protein
MIGAERPLQTPCEWCGAAVQQNPTGRLLRYCDRSCRQRAYETRTAQRRRQADVDAGVIHRQPAERVVERVVRDRHPRTATGWETALDALAAQFADDTIPAWHADRIRQAFAAVEQQMAAAEARLSGHTPAATTGRSDGHGLAAAVEARITAAGGTLPTRLGRLAADLDADINHLRRTLIDLERLDRITARCRGAVTAVDELAVNARCEISIP